jgi:hypothetical protein
MSTPEVARLAFGQGFALLVADEQHLVLIELGKAGSDRAVVAKRFVAMQFDKLAEDQVQVIRCHRAIGDAARLQRFPKG